MLKGYVKSEHKFYLKPIQTWTDTEIRFLIEPYSLLFFYFKFVK